MKRQIQRVKQPGLWILAFAIALCLFYISFYGFRFSWLTEPEKWVVSFSASVKKGGKDKDYIKDNFLLVNTAQDITLAKTDTLDEAGGKYYAITNRQQLAKLLTWLAVNDSAYAMAVCDLQFFHPSANGADDTSMQAAIRMLLKKKHPKVIFAGEADETNEAAFKPSFFTDISDAPGLLGNTQYQLMGHSFIEYSLAQNKSSIKSLPLLLYEKLYGSTVNGSSLLPFTSAEGPAGVLKVNMPDGKSKRIWNTYAPELFFTSEDIEEIPSYEADSGSDSSRPARVRLANAAEASTMHYLCKPNTHKIIFIGSFGKSHDDRHETMYGETDGSVILINIFYGLQHGKNKVSLLLLLFLFVVFFALSTDIVFNGLLQHRFYQFISVVFLLFLPLLVLENLGKKSPGLKKAFSDLKNWIEEETHYFMLVFTALVANIFCSRIINIIVIALLVSFLHKLFGYLYEKKPLKKRG